MDRYARYIKRHIFDVPSWIIRMRFGSNHTGEDDNTSIAIFDTSIGTDNIGDEIIMDYCNNRLTEIFSEDFLHVPLQTKPSHALLKKATEAKYKFVCGTNLLYPKMEQQSQWIFGSPFYAYKGICLLGVGWNSYSKESVSSATQYFFKKYLSSDLIHSVRDNYTKDKLNKIGITNVVNTACPSMWKLDSHHCNTIPQKKADKVVTTLTDYSKNEKADRLLLNLLIQNYTKVFLWIQGDGDEKYYNSLNIDHNGKVILVPQTLKSYDDLLNTYQVDYVGTRLHAGIRALNAGIRTIIIGVDNRANEISKDTNLCVIKRDDIAIKLDSIINSSWKTEIILPTDNIKKWQTQFK